MELEAIMLSEVTVPEKKPKGESFPAFVDAKTKYTVGRQTEQLYYYIPLYLKANVLYKFIQEP